MDVKTLGRLPHRNTEQRTVRVPDDVWERVRAKATTEGMTISEAVRGLLALWLTETPAAPDLSPPSAGAAGTK